MLLLLSPWRLLLAHFLRARRRRWLARAARCAAFALLVLTVSVNLVLLFESHHNKGEQLKEAQVNLRKIFFKVREIDCSVFSAFIF